jgi:hypothetical protein
MDLFVLVDKASGGVYAVKDDTITERVVQLFQEEEDAERYHGYLIANDYQRELIITQVDEQQVKDNCASFGYVYTVIRPTDIVYPPSDTD